MKRYGLAAVIGLAMVFFVAGMASAQGAGQGNAQSPPRVGCQERFKTMDTNNDGQVTKEEFMAVPHYRSNAEQMFKEMDVNGRGYITMDEFCAGKGMGRGRGMGKGAGKGANQ